MSLPPPLPPVPAAAQPRRSSTSSTMGASSLEQSGGDMLLCDICLEHYDDDKRAPKFLACFHSFCEACLLQVAAKNNSLECPACRKVMHLPSGGVKQLQTNFYVTHIQDTLEKMSTANAAAKTHMASLCQRHSNQPLSFYCVTCSVAICRDCTVLDHRSEDVADDDKAGAAHVIQDVADAEIQQRDALANQVEQSRAIQANMSSQLAIIDTEKGNLDIAKTSVLKTIDDIFQVYHRLLDERQAAMCKTVLEMYRDKESSLMDTSDKINTSLKKLTIGLASGEKMSRDGLLRDVVNAKDTLQKTTDDLRQMANDVTIGQNYIKLDSKHGLQDFKTSVDALSRITSEDDLPSRVHYEFSQLIASVPVVCTVQVFGFRGKERLLNYPLDILVYDPSDVVIPSKCVVTELGCSLRFFPQVSGIHKLVPLFLGEPITGAETTAVVKPNNPLLKVGELGSGEGKFCCPRAIASDVRGNLYVADTGNKLIQKFDKDGNFINQFKISEGSDDCSTCDLALNQQRGVIVCTETMVGSSVNPTMGNTVATYTTDGILKHKFCNKNMKCALCVATNSHNEIIISDYLVHSLFMYDEHGNFLRRIGNSNAFNHPAFICIGENDSVIVSDTNNDVIQIFDRHGKFKQQFGKSGSGKGCLKQPFGVADDGERFLVVDSGNKRIQVFDRDGKFISMIESTDDPLNQPRGIVITNDGHVWVADRDSNCIKKFRYK